ncbi:MAG TPA: universal stress protein [Desulfobacteraceae bacterium]|nr:universal stress protein [Desulfobacteraceae bacterium]
MTVLPNILLASDFSKGSTLALKRAASLALDLNIRLELLHVVEDSLLDHFFPPQQKAREKSRLAEAALRRLREEAEREIPAGVAYHCRVETGKAFLAIILTARRVQASLIVVAAHGRHSLRDLFIGTTAEKVVRKADLPVLVVKNAPRAPYRRVLAPTDFSAAAGNALATALTLAPDAQIDPLHVYTLWGGGYLASPTIRDAAQERYQKEMRTRVSSSMADWLRGIETGDRRIRKHIRQGRPGALIPKVAKELAVDLVAMGTTGRSGLSHVLLGSVAEHALWQVPCDLLTVRAAGFRFELP